MTFLKDIYFISSLLASCCFSNCGLSVLLPPSLCLSTSVPRELLPLLGISLSPFLSLSPILASHSGSCGEPGKLFTKAFPFPSGHTATLYSRALFQLSAVPVLSSSQWTMDRSDVGHFQAYPSSPHLPSPT